MRSQQIQFTKLMRKGARLTISPLDGEPVRWPGGKRLDGHMGLLFFRAGLNWADDG